MALTEMQHDAIRNRLMDSAMHAVAEKGMENVSTRDVGLASGINDAYIYRYFSGKENLLAETFAREDGRILQIIEKGLSDMEMTGLNAETRCWSLFSQCWEYINENADSCLFMIRYYYSAAFMNYEFEAHCKRSETILKMLRAYFRKDSDVNLVMGNIYCSLMEIANRIIHKRIPKNKKTKQLLFELIKNTIIPHLEGSQGERKE